MDYTVAWTINITADSPEEAAQEALRIQRDPDSIAHVFDIFDDLPHGRSLFFP